MVSLLSLSHTSFLTFPAKAQDALRHSKGIVKLTDYISDPRSATYVLEALSAMCKDNGSTLPSASLAHEFAAKSIEELLKNKKLLKSLTAYIVPTNADLEALLDLILALADSGRLVSRKVAFSRVAKHKKSLASAGFVTALTDIRGQVQEHVKVKVEELCTKFE